MMAGPWVLLLAGLAPPQVKLSEMRRDARVKKGRRGSPTCCVLAKRPDTPPPPPPQILPPIAASFDLTPQLCWSTIYGNTSGGSTLNYTPYKLQVTSRVTPTCKHKGYWHCALQAGGCAAVSSQPDARRAVTSGDWARDESPGEGGMCVVMPL